MVETLEPVIEAQQPPSQDMVVVEIPEVPYYPPPESITQIFSVFTQLALEYGIPTARKIIQQQLQYNRWYYQTQVKK